MDPVRGVSLATLLALLFAASTAAARKQGAGWDGKIKMSTSEEQEAPADSASGVRWAVLLAGSSGYGNYRHQVCSKFSSTDIGYCLSFSLV
jgi:legumain